MVFSKRYKDLIDEGHGLPKDYICGVIPYTVKKKIREILNHFAEPENIKPNRYDNYEVHTTAYEIAANKLNEILGYPAIALNFNIFNSTDNQDIFTPWLFDLIELQFIELSDGEKVAFQDSINALFQENDLPWIICDGRMTKIDAQQFELDVRARALKALHELKDSDTKFQSAYDELMRACEFLEKGNYPEAIANAGKSYESVLKVICGIKNGNADKLTIEYANRILHDLPSTMNNAGFREKVMMALPFIRNTSSSDHGGGQTTPIITKPLAKLAINLSAAMNTYLVEEYVSTINTFETSKTAEDK